MYFLLDLKKQLILDLYKVGYFDEPIPEEEDLPEMVEVEVEDGDEIKYYKKIDKFIEFDGIECF